MSSNLKPEIPLSCLRGGMGDSRNLITAVTVIKVGGAINGQGPPIRPHTIKPTRAVAIGGVHLLARNTQYGKP